MTKEMDNATVVKTKVGNTEGSSCEACSTPAEKWTGSMPDHVITGVKGPAENVTTTAPKIAPDAVANAPKKAAAKVAEPDSKETETAAAAPAAPVAPAAEAKK
jgi:hypothetical protein